MLWLWCQPNPDIFSIVGRERQNIGTKYWRKEQRLLPPMWRVSPARSQPNGPVSWFTILSMRCQTNPHQMCLPRAEPTDIVLRAAPYISSPCDPFGGCTCQSESIGWPPSQHSVTDYILVICAVHRESLDAMRPVHVPTPCGHVEAPATANSTRQTLTGASACHQFLSFHGLTQILVEYLCHQCHPQLL